MTVLIQDEFYDVDVFPSSVKRPAGMGSILNRIGSKKLKMSTLEKSKLDWDTFKSEEGIADELAIHNRGKEGYVSASLVTQTNTSYHIISH